MTGPTTETHPCAAALSAQMKLRGIPSQQRLTRELDAAGLKTSQSTLSLMLSGKTPDLSTARKLAEFFAVPVTTFMPELAALVPAGDPDLPRFPLERTRLARHNERTHYVEEDIAALAGDIAERGLMQNLIGYQDGEIAEVYGGGRRWRALRLLATWGTLPADLQLHGIPFKLYATRLECLQATVAENAQREDVHFLDRGAALARIRDESGHKAARIARDLCMGERLVQQLLQINDKLPDWARERAFLSADDPQHLKVRDCRDLVEQAKAAPAQAPEQEKGSGVPLPLTMPPPRFTADEARAAMKHMQATAAPTPKGASISDRLKDLLAKNGELKRSDLNAGTEVNWAADVESLNREFGINITREQARTIPTLGAMARYIIAGAADHVRAESEAPKPSPAAMPAHPVSATVAAPHFTDFNITALWPGGNRAPNELTLLDRSTGREIIFVPAQRDIEDTDGGVGNAILQEMQKRGLNLHNAFAGPNGQLASIVVMRTADRSTTIFVPKNSAPGAGKD